MKTQSLFFTAPRRLEIREKKLPPPVAEEVLVETIVSAISPGSELLIYRGEFPENLSGGADEISANLRYPLAYGYACVGRVIASGPAARAWQDRLVFSFQPHCSHFLAAPAALMPVPANLTPESACFLPNMETAVNLIQDAAPILGERALVLGQGIVGLLTTALLAQFPLEILVSADKFARRRAAALEAGAALSLDPAEAGFRERARIALQGGADFTLEVSGAPAALNDALALTAFSGRVIIGSWYGQKRAPLDLGGDFHRSRLRLIASQVSTLAPELSGRWDKLRRFETAWRALAQLRPEKWITQRFPLSRAAEAYRLLDETPGEAVQVLFEYP
ncbi:MAG: zinc-binding alcohol dehydrogenase [Anaerolineales bacterium]